MTSAGGAIVLILLLWFYLLPAWLAHRRKHHNEKALFALNLLLGWTLIGWTIALIWAFAKPPTVTIAAAEPQILELPDEMRERYPCPFCAEAILPQANVCRFCNRDLPAGWSQRKP